MVVFVCLIVWVEILLLNEVCFFWVLRVDCLDIVFFREFFFLDEMLIWKVVFFGVIGWWDLIFVFCLLEEYEVLSLKVVGSFLDWIGFVVGFELGLGMGLLGLER